MALSGSEEEEKVGAVKGQEHGRQLKTKTKDKALSTGQEFLQDQ